MLAARNRKAERGLMSGAAGAISALLVFLIGCSEGPVCKDLGGCGGDPLDKWAQLPRAEETPGTYCQEAMHTPPIEGQRREQLQPVARERLPDPTNADWCNELVVTSDRGEALKNHNYWWENLPYVNGFLNYLPDGTYRANLTRKGFVDRWYSQTCMHKYGYTGTCKDLQADFERANQGAGEYNTFDCTDDVARGGCNCHFQIFQVNTLYGSYSISGSTITHYPASPNGHFAQATFCVTGDKIQLSGLNNSYFLDRAGLRTLEMVRMNCNDGQKGPGELGVDCGLGCPNPCPVP